MLRTSAGLREAMTTAVEASPGELDFCALPSAHLVVMLPCGTLPRPSLLPAFYGTCALELAWSPPPILKPKVEKPPRLSAVFCHQ